MLPRFNSGQIGRLTFEHLNEICDTVDRLRPLLTAGAGFVPTSSDLAFARITATQGTYQDYRWVEVWPKSKADYNRYVEWEDRPDGRRSFASTDGDKYQPAYAVPLWGATTGAGVTLGVNSIVSIMRLVGADGRVSWLILSAVSQSVIPAIITGAQTLGAATNPPTRWKYTWKEVVAQINVPAGQPADIVWVLKPGGAAGGSTNDGPYAINGCETGTIPGSGPAGAIVSLAPIGINTVVPLAFSAQSAYFSIPNGLNVQCPP
jgi:hypothetical protein